MSNIEHFHYIDVRHIVPKTGKVKSSVLCQALRDQLPKTKHLMGTMVTPKHVLQDIQQKHLDPTMEYPRILYAIVDMSKSILYGYIFMATGLHTYLYLDQEHVEGEDMSQDKKSLWDIIPAKPDRFPAGNHTIMNPAIKREPKEKTMKSPHQELPTMMSLNVDLSWFNENKHCLLVTQENTLSRLDALLGKKLVLSWRLNENGENLPRNEILTELAVTINALQELRQQLMKQYDAIKNMDVASSHSESISGEEHHGKPHQTTA